MKPHKLLNSNAVIALTVVLGTTSLLPSCALKRLADRESTEASAANAAALEEALAILDEAIEETAPASEINSIPLDVPCEHRLQ